MSAVAQNVRRLGRIVPGQTALFLCDMQEKFRPMIQYFPEIVHNSNRVLNAAQMMDLPTFVTEQYPKVSVRPSVRPRETFLLSLIGS